MHSSTYMTNNDALDKLHKELTNILNQYKTSKNTWRNYFGFLFDDNILSLFTWKSSAILLFMIISLIVSYFILPER